MQVLNLLCPVLIETSVTRRSKSDVFWVVAAGSWSTGFIKLKHCLL